MENYGRRLLPSILHYEAEHNPQRTFALIARTDNLDDAVDHVTYRQVAAATNWVSRWLLDRFEDGKPLSGHPTLAYFGPNDLRYNILFYGAIQCRYKVFLPSPRNPVVVNVSLFEQTECMKLVHTTETAPVVKSIEYATGTTSLRCEQLPSLQDLLTVPHIHFEYDLTYADVYQEPILVLHSSGSTGRPKPVESTHGTFATIDIRDFPTVPGRRNQDFASTFHFSEPETYMYGVFPSFHLAGFFANVVVPLMIGTIPIFDPPSRPSSGALVAKTIRLCNPRGLYLPPVVIEQIFQEPDREELFRKRDIVFYAGGSLSHDTGSQISGWTQLCQFYGSTEMGQVRQLQPSRDGDDWAYLEFHPHEAFELQPIEDGSGLHELVLFTGKHLERTSAIYHNFPDLTEWRTKDLFERHPTKPSLWKFRARVDDIIVLSSGEKLNSLPLESHMSSVAGVIGALVVGTRHPKPALLLELDGEHTFVNPLQELWPSVQMANELLPSHGRITRSMVVIADVDKPFKRAPKGSIVRRQTEDLYADEIHRLYNAPSTKVAEQLIPSEPSLFQKVDVDLFVHSVLRHVAMNDSIDDDAILFEHGLDSLKTTEIVGLLKANLLAYKPEEKLRWLSVEIIYLNPTIERLSNVLLMFLNDDKVPIKLDSIEEMRAKVTEYTSDLPSMRSLDRISHGCRSERSSIAITGTTGFFGQYLLSRLIDCPEITRIYCLNRSPTAQEKFRKLGLQYETELIFLRINLRASRLGLQDKDYNELLKNCSLVIHNAWQVDFNLPLASFSTHLEGVRQIISLCAKSTLRARLVFVSSIAATGVWSPPECPVKVVPEELTSIQDVARGLNIGYAKSKWVAEHMLDMAASQLAIPVTILRLGHILPAASSGTSWPPDDSLALFLQTSKMLGRLAPDFLDTVNWSPVDSAADIASEVVQNLLRGGDGYGARPQVFNIVNPYERSWSSVMEILTPWCGAQAVTLPMQQWVEELHKIHGGDLDASSRLPALRILHFFDVWTGRGRLHQYDTSKSMSVSKAMRAMQAPSNGLIVRWLGLL